MHQSLLWCLNVSPDWGISMRSWRMLRKLSGAELFCTFTDSTNLKTGRQLWAHKKKIRLNTECSFQTMTSSVSHRMFVIMSVSPHCREIFILSRLFILNNIFYILLTWHVLQPTAESVWQHLSESCWVMWPPWILQRWLSGLSWRQLRDERQALLRPGAGLLLRRPVSHTSEALLEAVWRRYYTHIQKYCLMCCQNVKII